MSKIFSYFHLNEIISAKIIILDIQMSYIESEEDQRNHEHQEGVAGYGSQRTEWNSCNNLPSTNLVLSLYLMTFIHIIPY